MEEQQESTVKKLEDLPDILNVADVQAYLRIGQNAAYELINSGQILGFKIGRLTRVKKKELIKYLEVMEKQGVS